MSDTHIVSPSSWTSRLTTHPTPPLRQSGQVAAALVPIVRRNYLPALFVNYVASTAVSVLAAAAGVTWVWWWFGLVTLVSLVRIAGHRAMGAAMARGQGPTPEREIFIAGLGKLAAAVSWAARTSARRGSAARSAAQRACSAATRAASCGKP